MKARATYSAAHRIFTFSALAISYPIYSRFSASPTYFVALKLPPVVVFSFVLILSFLLPLALTSLIALSNFGGKKVRKVVESCLVSALAGLMLLNLLNAVPYLSSTFRVLIAYLLAIAFAHQYISNHSFRASLVFLLPLAFFVPLQFVFGSSMKPILFPNDSVQERSIVIERTPPVFLIVWDELPLHTLLDVDGNIDAERFPNFAKLADASTWYANATTVGWRTEVVLASIVTGNFPPSMNEGVAPVRESFPDNIFALLESQYDIHAHEPTTAFNSRFNEAYDFQQSVSLILSDSTILYLRTILPSQLANFLKVPVVSNVRWGDFAQKDASIDNFIWGWSSGRSKEVEDFIREIDEYPARTLHFLHVLLPHSPWIYLPSGRVHSYIRNEVLERAGIFKSDPYSSRGSDQVRVDSEEHAHRLQVAYVDKLLGSLIEQIKLTGLFDESLIVITADHGMSFQAGQPFRYPTSKNYAEIAYVPLFIKYPGQRIGEIDRTNVQVIDILPTVLDVLGAKGTIQCDGRSLIDPNAKIPSQKTMIAMGPVRSEDSSDSSTDRPKLGTWGTMKGYTGDVILRLSKDEYLKSRDALSQLKVQSLSLGDPRATLSHYGPGLEFIGASYTTLRARKIACEIPLNLDLNRRLNVSHKTTLPTILSGEVTGCEEEIENLFVVAGINGIVQGKALLYCVNNKIYFDLFLPEEIFDQKINEVEMMVIR